MVYYEQENSVLWVCRENIGRSQVAEALCQKYYPEIDASSVGIQVDHPGQIIGELPVAQTVISSMRTLHDIDIAHKEQTDLHSISEEALGRTALVMVLAEPEVIPDSLRGRDNVRFHEIPDIKGEDNLVTDCIIGMIDDTVHEAYSELQRIKIDEPIY